MCAIFGLIDYNRTLNAKQRQRLLRVLSEECEERGTDATGYAFNQNGKLTIFKRPYSAHKVHLRLPEDLWDTPEWQRKVTSLITATTTHSPVR